MQIAIAREKGGTLVIEEAEYFAIRFFDSDVSSDPDDSYDECARLTDPQAAFTWDDVAPIRTGMRLARLKHSTWPWLVSESPRAFLTNVDPSWDLVELPEDSWGSARDAIASALYDFMGEGRGAPVATKFLHYKRRRLVPILDRRVLEMTGLRVPDPTTSKVTATIERSRKRRAEAATAACERMRRYAIDNVDVLRKIQVQLATRGKDRTLARILDAILWSSHPASAPSRLGTIQWSRNAG